MQSAAIFLPKHKTKDTCNSLTNVNNLLYSYYAAMNRVLAGLILNGYFDNIEYKRFLLVLTTKIKGSFCPQVN